MNTKSIGMLIMAVVCGLGAMVLTMRMISKDKKSQPEQTQDVLVAVRDLKIEEIIKPDMVKVVRMARSAVPSGAFSSPKDVEDRWVQVGLVEGDPIVDRKLAPKGSPPGLVARIPKGMRAFAIEVNEQTGVSGFVLPDHRVDVVQMSNGGNGESLADTLLQDVQVLASGQTMTRPEDKAIQVRTVTLALTPEQVDTLVSAKHHGALSLSLRGLNDHTQAKPSKKLVKETPPPPPVIPKEPPVVVVKAPEPTPPPPPPAPPAPRFVTIYRGFGSPSRVQIDQTFREKSEELVSASYVPNQ